MGNFPFERFLNIRWASGASFRRDGQRMAFLTDISGTAQLWTLDAALAWPEQLTFFDDRLTFAEYSPTDPRIAFGKDSGGDEDELIYLIRDRGGLPRRLSVTDAKHLWGGWCDDGKRVAWSHNGRNGRDFDIFVYDLEADEETCVHHGEGYNFNATWLPDGERLVFSRAESNVECDLYLLDIATGETTLLTAHDGEAYFAHPQVSPDGTTVYAVANASRDFENLVRIDLESSSWAYIEEYEWGRDGLAISDDGRFLAMLSNEDGYSCVQVRDLEADDSWAIEELPRGVAVAPRFLPHSTKISVAVTAPNDSADVWVADVETCETERWTRSSMAGIPRHSLSTPDLIHYETFDGRQIPAFYYRPDGEGSHPVIVDIHGGPEGQRRPMFMAFVQYYVQEGFAVLSPNVRGSAGYGRSYMALDDVRKRMDSVKDIRAAYDWLCDEGGADPERIALIGGSYGGFMVLSSLVTYPALWAAGVDIVGIANFVTFLENTADYRRHLREREYGSLEDDREFLEEISPLNHIDEIQAPLMVVHGRNDPRVPVGEAEQVVAAMREKGVPVESIIYDDEGHGLAKRKNRLDAFPRIAEFLRQHLGE